MSIQSNFPAISPTLNLSFALTKALDPRITFARASTGTYYGTQTAKAEENLVLQSQAFNENAWQKTEVTATANSIAAPDGTTTADTLTNTTVNTLHIAFQAATLNGQAYTFSVFAKKGTADFVYLRGSDGTSARQAWFNLATGAVGTVETNITASITDVGNGWYRCVGVWSISSSASANYSIGISEANGVSSYAGTTKDIYLWGAQLEQRSAVTAYTPTTTQPITNYISQLLTAASGVARFDHNPITDESLGLLIEEQRTNLRTYSEDFTNAVWTKSAASIAADTVIAPDGTLTGDKLVEDTATSRHFVTTSLTLTANTVYTLSVYMKAGERTTASFGLSSTANWAASSGIVVNLATGVVTSGTGTIQSVGNGWYRVSITQTFGPANANGGMIIDLQTTAGYTGNGFSGIYIWGAQIEAGAFPTSYIPTVASQVTRAADAASMTGANFSSWFNNAEGTVYFAYQGSSGTAGRRSFSISDGTNNNKIYGIASNGGGSASNYIDIVASGTSQGLLGATGAYTATLQTGAAAYAINNINFSKNGGAATTDTSALIPVVNQLRIGADADATLSLNGTIRKIAYYPLAATSAQLQGLTS